MDELKAPTYAYEPPVHSELPDDLQNKLVLSSPLVYASSCVNLAMADGGEPLIFMQGDCVNLGEQACIFIAGLQICETQYDEVPVSPVWKMIPSSLKSRLQQADPIAIFWDPTTGLHIRVSAL